MKTNGQKLLDYECLINFVEKEKSVILLLIHQGVLFYSLIFLYKQLSIGLPIIVKDCFL